MRKHTGHSSNIPRITWGNTNPNQWLNEWEIAKCYISGFGYIDAKGKEDIDLPGLLDIVINMVWFRKKYPIIGKNKRSFEKVIVKVITVIQ